jgi:hypothetical protein
LKTIVIRNSGRYFSSNGISYADGALVIDHLPQANVDEEEDERAARILELLKAASGRSGTRPAPPPRSPRPDEAGEAEAH